MPQENPNLFTHRAHSPAIWEKLATKYFPNEEKQPRPATVTIGRTPTEVYAFCKDLTNMPLFIKDVIEVKMISERVSQWKMQPQGSTEQEDPNAKIVEWESETLISEPSIMAWRSVGNPENGHLGVVTFEPAQGNRGTVVSMRMSEDKSKGKLAGVFSFFVGKEPASRATINLRRLKCLLETGEIPTIQGQSNGNDETNNLKKQ
jgi:uncharacterized membrane protein